MVVNYREINALTVAPDFPLPPIATILEMLGGAKYFSSLDLESGYHQIRMAREDSSDIPGNATLLKQVLSIQQKNYFFPKFSKCEFAKKELTYLGYTVSAEGIKPAADKVAAVQQWPEVLQNVTQVRQFLGTVKYCRMFMGADCPRVARPLLELTRKWVHFKWTEAHTQAVQQLKRKLTDYVTLQIPDTTKPFDLYTDASGFALGAVLEQEGKPFGFLSQTVNAAQQKYSIYDQELLALVTALDKWSHLLRAAKVMAYTDHQALTHLQQLKASKPLRGRTARWLDFLAEFPELTISYLPGTRNQVEDALSRNPGGPTTKAPSSIDTPQVSSVSLAPAEVPLTPHRETRRRRNDYRQLAGIRARTRQQRRSEKPTEAPLDTQQQHDRPQQQTCATHKPNSPTHALDWAGAYSKCSVFREAYTAAAKTPGETVHVEIHQRRYGFCYQHPYLRICQNGIWLICVPQLPEFLTHILYQFYDHVGDKGQAHVAPSSAADTVALLADRLIRYHGFPETLVSDRDPRFTSEIWEALCSRFNIRAELSPRYHPQTDGQTERVNRTLEEMLRRYIQTDEKEWEHLLPALELAYNTTPHSSTELSPFEVMIGENPLTAADLDIVGTLPPTLSPPMTKLFQRLCDRAQAHILQAKWRQKYYADTRRRPMEYKVGDRVWISSRHQR
ncbi:hypothetical protein EMWEY_00026150 [Eimeria maxima]|uniref:Integrase catalytic domain-containing protein n=1 Tax=Eimeria maxima TaxID=5804 RepID=U6LYQ1_EIMMA|nr:hypothetical protein EMWEY_00026150 [Eimeria maxima]CDJ56886.1 hypothetical protein EMWEY_00026150 [Eimeria maxima]